MARLIGSQKRDQGTHLARRRHLSKRYLADHRSNSICVEVIGNHLGFSETGRDGECENAVLGEATGDGFGQGHEGAFGRAIGHLVARLAAKRGPARDIDDLSAAPSSKVPDRGTAKVCGRAQVDLQHAIPGTLPGVGIAIHRRRFEYTGVVYQDVDLEAEGLRILPNSLSGSRQRQIFLEQMAPVGADLGAEALGGTAIGAVMENDVRARRARRADDGGANASRSACDEEAFAGQVNHDFALGAVRDRRS